MAVVVQSKPPEQTRRRGPRGKGPVALAAGVLAGLLIGGFTVWRASDAAFDAYRDARAGNRTPGTVDLDDDDGGTAMFASTGLTPGAAAQERCIRVRYRGTVDAGGPVRLFGDAAVVGLPGDLSPYLNLVIEMGDDRSAGTAPFGCTAFRRLGAVGTPGTLFDFQLSHGSYGTGVATAWTPRVGESRTFRFVTSVRSDPAAIGAHVDAVPFTWATRA